MREQRCASCACPSGPRLSTSFSMARSRNELPGPPGGRSSQRPMGLYRLRPDVPPLPIRRRRCRSRRRSRRSLCRCRTFRLKDRRLWWQRMISIIPPRSFVKDVQTLVNSGPPATCFDVVILGDGFTEAELPIFDARALADRECAHDHAAIQHDGCQHQHSCGPSGIRRLRHHRLSGSEAIRRTFFEMRGNFNGEGFGDSSARTSPNGSTLRPSGSPRAKISRCFSCWPTAISTVAAHFRICSWRAGRWARRCRRPQISRPTRWRMPSPASARSTSAASTTIRRSCIRIKVPNRRNRRTRFPGRDWLRLPSSMAITHSARSTCSATLSTSTTNR